MDDSSNWEFAAAVAAISIGLGGLLLFALVTSFTHWRVLREAAQAATSASKASVAVEELVRQLQPSLLRGAGVPGHDATELEALRRQTGALMEQQTRLQDAMRNLLDAGLLRGEESRRQYEQLEAAVRKLDLHLNELAAAVANVTAHGG